MKKLAIWIGVLLAVLVGVVAVIPFFVNVDQYRPQIVEAANRQVNGRLELGKLSLSLWGQVRIEVAGLRLFDAQGHEVVGVRDAYFYVPFLSLISGSPILTFTMNHPSVNILKNKAGNLNVLSLVKKSGSAPSTSSGTSSSGGGSTATPGTVALPGIVTRARLGVELKSAWITYKDESTGLSTEVKDLNFVMRDISLSHPMDLELWADLDTQLGKTFRLQGPARMTAQAQPELKGGRLDHVSMTAHLDLDSVEMTSPGLFQKRKGIPTSAELAVTASEQDVKIEKLLAKFFNAEVSAHGTVTNVATTSGATSPVVNLEVKSNDIEFKPWVELIPMLKEFELGGSARLEAEANGPSQKLNYHARLSIQDLTAKASQLKVQPRLDGMINITTDQVEQIQLTLKAPGNDLKIQGKWVSFSRPRMNFEISSTGMDLDQLVSFPPPVSAESTKVHSGGSPTKTAPGVEATSAEDWDALLAPIRTNPILTRMVANVGLKMAMLKAKGVKMTDLGCKWSMKDLAMGLEQCSLKVFGGSIQTNAWMQLKPKTPTYRFKSQVAGLEISQAVESQMALFKNTVTGKAHFNMTGEGASFNPDPAMAHLKVNGNLKVENASFATIDVMKMVAEGLNKAIGQIGEKIPAAKGKTVGNLPNTGSKYEFISSDFSISDGKFTAPNFYAKAIPRQGIDIRGKTAVGLKDKSLDTNWDVIDTYNLTHARDLSIEQNGVKVDHILAEGDSPVHFPIHAGCTLAAPCYSYTDVAGALIKVATNNVTAAVGNRAKEEIKKRAGDLIQHAPPALQDKLKGFFH